MTDLATRVTRFMALFNGDDLEATVQTFAADGVYVDPFGVSHQGPQAVRAAFAPIFDGSMGAVHYIVDETVLDEPAEKALVTWTLQMRAPDGKLSSLRGLDILRFEGDQLKSKNCYCKASGLLIE